jgi:uncharacterized protein
MDKVVHFEIPAANIDRAKKFYKSTFGWKIIPMPEYNYNSVRTTEVDKKMMPKQKGVINGGLMKRDKIVKTPVITILVRDIDFALERVKQNGGKISMKKTAIGAMGFAAYFKDSEGNVMGLFEATGM